ncbi:hypothetical protein CNEO4_270201 [Clostridium neonatale]|uniref:hypothetical protein n=1 Tax=Clostridium neonatale TaxID=137838 RepID=UPI00291BF3D3|nr:hypothetical protein [Clostridium neonatale]CAI3633581.1 hypothetical protein CNEO4_270201 [Clostridium neonatale]
MEKEDNKQEEFKKDIKSLKKYIEGLVDTILFEDESMIMGYQAILKNCFIKDHQKNINL